MIPEPWVHISRYEVTDEDAIAKAVSFARLVGILDSTDNTRVFDLDFAGRLFTTVVRSKKHEAAVALVEGRESVKRVVDQLLYLLWTRGEWRDVKAGIEREPQFGAHLVMVRAVGSPKIGL